MPTLIFAIYCVSMNKLSLFLFAVCLVTACNNNTDTQAANPDKTVDNSPPILNFTVMKSYPHDTSAYTEGFLFHDGKLYESTGTDSDWGPTRRSLFGIVDTLTGKIRTKVEIDKKKYFGEGIVFLRDK